MKQGTNFILPIKIGMDLSLISGVDFIFRHLNKSKTFHYPSEVAVKSTTEENTINLIWSSADTYNLGEGKAKMDTRISLVDSDYNPETEIVEVTINETLFSR